jgi:hypothetical protein
MHFGSEGTPSITAIGDNGYETHLCMVMEMDKQEIARFIGELHADLAAPDGRWGGLRLAASAPRKVEKALEGLKGVSNTICRRLLHDIKKQSSFPPIPEPKGKQRMAVDMPEQIRSEEGDSFPPWPQPNGQKLLNMAGGPPEFVMPKRNPQKHRHRRG